MPRSAKTEIYSVLWLHHNKNSVAEISKELNIEEKKIIKILEKHNVTNTSNSTTTASEKAKNKAANLMINTTANKKTKNVSVMTQAASMSFDEHKKHISTRSLNDKNIFKPNG